MRAGTSRRGFLTGAAAAIAAGGLGGLLSGCGANEVKAKLLFQALPPSPFHPVLWPIHLDNLPIPGGQRPERDATLRVICWPGRIGHRCLIDFQRKYKCRVELRTFSTMTEGINLVSHRGSQVDVLLGGTLDVLSTLINGNLIQPLNQGYITNINQVWAEYTNPFYDQRWQYTVPYTIYTTGIGWRKDLVEANPFAMVNGWNVLWDAKFKGKVAVLNDYREGIGLGLLQTGTTNLNTPDPRLIDAAGGALAELVRLVRPRLSTDVFRELGTGKTAIAQCWSGQVAAAAQYLTPGLPHDVLGYWFPPDGSGPVANDTMTIPRNARNPVLAHLFLNFMLNRPNAVDNVRQTGFMQPLTWMTPERMVNKGVIPSALITTTVLQNYFYRGLKELQLQIGAQALWHQEWNSVARQLN
ncbi:MAG TPA: extracellular solute-binding protein [Streptosporangiaceae bacterium]|nr:extracellular solute-binding protein [Streptosporangiaceae bacterium]